MDGPPIDQRDYVRRLLEAYRATPGTSGAVHRADRLLAAQLHERGVPLEAVENAFVLAATRRMIRSAGCWKPIARRRVRRARCIVRTDCLRPNCTNAAYRWKRSRTRSSWLRRGE